jgi:hypothetical protein
MGIVWLAVMAFLLKGCCPGGWVAPSYRASHASIVAGLQSGVRPT